MFTGLIECIGKVSERKMASGSGVLKIKLLNPWDKLEYGESIAVNGTCLTLEEERGGTLLFHVLEETLKKTNLGVLPIGAEVNLERAMLASGRFGGHMVQGHVDATSKIRSIGENGSDLELSIDTPDGFIPYMIEKGSITLDGVSLTLVAVNKEFFTVHIIPVTWKDTALRSRKCGDPINVETDLIGKYVERQLALRRETTKKSTVDMDSLSKAGW